MITAWPRPWLMVLSKSLWQKCELEEDGCHHAALTIELPDGAFSALRRSPQEFAKEMPLAAAVQ